MEHHSSYHADLEFGTAAGHLAINVPFARAHETVGEVRRTLLGKRYESVEEIVVREGGHLLGLVRMEDLLAARSATLIEAVMDTDPPVVSPGLDEEVVAWKAVQHGEGSLAVVDQDGNFLGLVPPSRMLGVLLKAHDEDIARFGGFIAGAEAARGATEEAMGRRLKHRLPWLIIGLVGALIAADVVGLFEAQLTANLAVAFFIPSIVYLADAVGTQTEALLVRGLSVGVIVRRVVRQEVLTGLLLGVLLGVLIFLPVAWRWDLEVALAVSLAVVAASGMATAVATLLPWAIFKAGGDPAFASGPLATVVQDILSVAVYLLIATAIL